MEDTDILAVIEGHIRASGSNPTKFGLDAVGDPNFVRDLRDGREPRRSTVRAVMEFIQTGKTKRQKMEEAA